MKPSISMLLACVTACALPVHAADQSEIDKIKQQLKLIEQSYQAKIDALQAQIKLLEEDVDSSNEKTEALAIEVSQKGNVSSPNTFNPGIGVILNGKYLSQSPKDYEFAPPGFFLGEEPGPGEPGLALGESEINYKANIDDKFYGSLTVAFGEEVEVEEAFVKTTALPHGLQLKLGRFFSNVGYLNSHHTHGDDFAFRPLAYQAFLGKNFGDDGIQLSWLAPTAMYWESGMEIYRGESFPASGAANNGNGITTVFTHIGGDINHSQSWRAGLSLVKANVVDRASEEDGGDLFSGDSDLWIADFTWKWAPNGNSKVNNAKIQAEYFDRKEKGLFTDSNDFSQNLDLAQSGWYVQGTYQFMPQWRIGARYEQLHSEDLDASFTGTTVDNQDYDPKQLSLMFDWSNSEFSRVRLQFSQDKSSPEKANLWTLQYITAFGAHGAHSF